MKNLMKPVDVLAFYMTDGSIVPQKFRYVSHDGQTHIIKIKKVMKSYKDKFHGYITHNFDCIGIKENGEEVLLALRYDTKPVLWYLAKM